MQHETTNDVIIHGFLSSALKSGLSFSNVHTRVFVVLVVVDAARLAHLVQWNILKIHDFIIRSNF